MSKQIDALKLAQEALELTANKFQKQRDAVTAIKEALAQPEQEPVGWIDDGGKVFWKDKSPKDGADLYTTPPQRKPPEAGDGHDLFYEAVRLLDNAIFAQSGDVVRHDSAAHREALDFFNHVFTRLDLTPPPQRKPLTDEQIDSFREANSEGRGAGWRFNFKGFARAIEAAHGIKE